MFHYLKAKLKLAAKLNVFFHPATYWGRTIELSESYLVLEAGAGFFYTLTPSSSTSLQFHIEEYYVQKGHLITSQFSFS